MVFSHILFNVCLDYDFCTLRAILIRVEMNAGAPLVVFSASREIYSDARKHLRQTTAPSLSEWVETLRSSFARRRRVTRRLSILTRAAPNPTSIFRLAMSPLSTLYKEVQTKQQRLKQLRNLQSAALGILVGESISLPANSDWRPGVERGVDVMESILKSLTSVTDNDVLTVDGLESKVFSKLSGPKSRRPPYLMAERMIRITDDLLPLQSAVQKQVAKEAGKPSIWIRYWPLALATVTFGGTALRILFNRRASIAQWGRDVASTARDFWYNWIVEPVSNIISTIRHDEEAQVAIVSRKSLEADMESLERMVVDFAVDTESSANISASQISAIKRGVREGDLSTVLRAYEKELKSPVKNALRGELIRTLLIQVQKTKVDVEVAITGIDRLLKSQELVFGFVAAIPSSVISWVIIKWYARLYTGKGMKSRGEQRATVIRTLGNIERMLTVQANSSRGQEAEWMSYSDQGLLLCEVHVLRNSLQILPGQLRGDWIRDLGDLENIKSGVHRQRDTISRIWRVYGKFLT